MHTTRYRSSIRVDHWNNLAAKVLPAHGINVIDPFHMTDGRLEKGDHTHFGLWAELESGIENPTLSTQNVNALANYLCYRNGPSGP